jgi:hypothetical protein
MNAKHRWCHPQAWSAMMALLMPVLALGLAGCQVAQETARLPGQMVTAVVPGMKSAPPDPAALQTAVLRYADDFTSRTAEALEDYVRRVNTPEARLQALTWRLAMDSAALGIATGPNPTANLVDFVALATLSRTFLEQRVPNAAPPGALDSWLEVSRALETNAWKLAEGFLTADQQVEFRAAMGRWCAQNSKAGSSFFARPQDLAALIRQSGEREGRSGGIFSLVGLDPTAGLDPAVREVTRTRLFAERALFAAERMPFFLRWQVELLAGQLLRQEQITNAIASADRLSRAVESSSQTAALLLDTMENQEGRLRELSAEVGRTLAAGEKMSTSLNTTLVTFDALMKRFGVGEPSAGPPDTNSPPFDILDYARTAERIAAMAQQLDALIKDTTGTLDSPALDKRIADLNAVSSRAKADAKSVLNHAFLLASALIVLAFATAWVYRRALSRSYQK